MISARVTIRKALGPLIGILHRYEVHSRRLLSGADVRLLRNASTRMTKPCGCGGRPSPFRDALMREREGAEGGEDMGRARRQSFVLCG
jgi:hypothetical protein